MSTTKSQLGRHCEGEARNNLLVIRAKGLLLPLKKRDRNDVFLTF